MDLKELRQKIDEIDDGLLDLFQKRMDISAEIARYKKENNIPVNDPAREKQKLLDISCKADNGFKSYVTEFFSFLFELSREEQNALLQTRNIVLIGMPGCGKTTIGSALAKKTGRPFADTDDFIAKTAGKSIPDLIADNGEENFRKLETEVLKEICKKSGLVIACGGGLVTQPCNRSIISHNSIVVFLDRALDQLPLEGRPISKRDGIEALAEKRLPLYREWSNYTVPVLSGNSVEQTVQGLFDLIGK